MGTLSWGTGLTLLGESITVDRNRPGLRQLLEKAPVNNAPSPPITKTLMSNDYISEKCMASS